MRSRGMARYAPGREQLGEDDVAELLHQTLEEEKDADAKLTSIASKSVNREAAAA